MRTTSRLREPLIDIDEVAGRLGVSTRYIRRLIAEHESHISRSATFCASTLPTLMHGSKHAQWMRASPARCHLRRDRPSLQRIGPLSTQCSTALRHGPRRDRDKQKPASPGRGGRAGVASVCTAREYRRFDSKHARRSGSGWTSSKSASRHHVSRSPGTRHRRARLQRPRTMTGVEPGASLHALRPQR